MFTSLTRSKLGVFALISSRFRWFVLLLSVLLLCFSTASLAEENVKKIEADRYKWFLTVYAGVFAKGSIANIYLLKPKFDTNANVAVVALAHEFWHHKDSISLEAEGQIGTHFNTESLLEFSGLIVGRWHKFPWDRYLDTSFAFGEGLSFYSKVSEVELGEGDDAQKILNYLLFELTFGLPQYPQWDLVVRIHHRSSVFGLYGSGGSNYLCGGIKYSF